MLGLFQAIERLAPSPLPVLIVGESGTGKELIARAIHGISGRPGPFVPVNVAGLDGTLFSDMLFGHVKGAYTGAEGKRPGLVKSAEGGTLFLDEIGDLGIDIQVKLLRFIQDGEYYPLGADVPEKNASRIVLATNVDLLDAVKAGRFRADLYYRLMIHSLAIPPLRDRKEDIGLLAEHFAQEAAKNLKIPSPSIDDDFIKTVEKYDFPGNIRELSALIYGAVSASRSVRPSVRYIRDYLSSMADRKRGNLDSGCGDAGSAGEIQLRSLRELAEEQIKEALRRTGGNQSAAAALLDISQSTISRLMKRLSMKKS